MKTGLPFDRFSASESDGQFIRTLDATEQLDIANYRITVYTGDIKGAGTDANVSITLFGEKVGMLMMRGLYDCYLPKPRVKMDQFDWIMLKIILKEEKWMFSWWRAKT